MSTAEASTYQNILNAAKAEFLEKGFRAASLRNIVKTANVTTGAFYGYCKSKEELFDALVGKQYNTIIGTLITDPASLNVGAAIAGLVIVAAMVAIVVGLINNTNKKLKEEYALSSAGVKNTGVRV